VAGRLLSAFATAADAPPITDQSQIDKLFRTYRWRVMFAITIGYGLIYTCRLAIGMAKPSMIDAGIFTPAEFGLIGSALFYTYALGKLTNGFIADHANIRLFLTIGFLMSAVCNIGMGFADTVLLATVLWGLNGWFQGFGAPGSVVAMTAWFSNKERGRAYGLWSTAHSLGEGLTFFVIGAVVAYFGWRWGYFVPAMIGFFAAAVMWVMVRDRRTTISPKAKARRQSQRCSFNSPSSPSRPSGSSRSQASPITSRATRSIHGVRSTCKKRAGSMKSRPARC
jgi:OPA family sugar phosphate sensor protein UhpC-like MFS transporter